MTTALITGATAGIGAEFASQLAGQGYDLVLVARDASRLAERAASLQHEFGVRVEALPADLLDPAGLDSVAARLQERRRPIGLLINNAGYGERGALHENTVEQEKRHLDIHVSAPLRLTQAALGGMLERGSGRIVLISSVAAFTPRGTYAAAKAWGVTFARGANLAYRDRGVSVTAVCPGFVHTEFHERMEVSTTGIPAFLWLDAPRVVRLALRGIQRGRSVVIPTLRYRVISGLARVLPDRVAGSGGFRSGGDRDAGERRG
ncbi:MAG: SDR family NAD(P)-dependent oxidoreductase [Microcella sp.]|uniref:SDR family NAD(P)-dependent oxidoreductase n=1 Tax=Microcella sp. TaxID=1913979 RepID=UPI003314B4EB